MEKQHLIKFKGRLKRILGFKETRTTSFGYLVLETEKGRLLWIKTAGTTTEYLRSLYQNCSVEVGVTLNNAEDINNFQFFALFIKRLKKHNVNN